MGATGEQVYCQGIGYLVALFFQQSNIPGKGGGVAGNIYNPPRGKAGKGFNGLREWRDLGHDEQLEWNALAKSVRSKRPPFNSSSHISGYNLFMSAYHGLACIGEERVPEPRPLPDFPVVYLELASAAVLNGTDLQISFRINGDTISDRLRIIGNIQLTAPGYSAHRGKFRNYVGVLSDEGFVSFVIHDFRSVCSLDLKEYQVHMKYFLIDANSGHRSKENPLSTSIEI